MENLKMSRIYRKRVGSRPYKNYTNESLDRAMQLVRNGSSYREAAAKFGIPWKTLWNKIKAKHTNSVGALTLLTELEERHFVDVLLATAEFGSPLTAFDLLSGS
ncbi:unnamed protein product [Ceutorhynchus assimilis]|uniref:HTH psq-type domain-containing protein n=1 Tax=Ceutorhynchus assimilis TaxID=467358 RepID=A0A9N9MG73_9CUCU|nr:unnamed protein product [Ceutorhynchus assimilis]